MAEEPIEQARPYRAGGIEMDRYMLVASKNGKTRAFFGDSFDAFTDFTLSLLHSGWRIELYAYDAEGFRYERIG